MVKYGKRKKYLIKSVNFGKPGEISRELIEEYEKSFGSNKTSEMIRDLITKSLSANKEFDYFKIRNLKEERKKIFQDIKESQAKLKLNAEKLSMLGLSEEAIINI